MTARDHPLRLFVAIYPPPAVAEALLAEAARVCPPAHRFVEPESVHLTAHFIGPATRRDLRRIVESVERSASGLGAFALAPIKLITLPAGPAPRLLAAQTDAPPPLLELHLRLVQRLARPGGRRETFTPHLTLVRFSGPHPPGPASIPLTMPTFAVDRVALMNSRPQRGRFVHERLADVLLDPPQSEGHAAASPDQPPR